MSLFQINPHPSCSMFNHVIHEIIQSRLLHLVYSPNNSMSNIRYGAFRWHITSKTHNNPETHLNDSLKQTLYGPNSISDYKGIQYFTIPSQICSLYHSLYRHSYSSYYFTKPCNISYGSHHHPAFLNTAARLANFATTKLQTPIVISGTSRRLLRLLSYYYLLLQLGPASPGNVLDILTQASDYLYTIILVLPQHCFAGL